MDDLAQAFPEADINLREKEFSIPYYYWPFFFVAKVVFWVIVGVYIYSVNNNLVNKTFAD